MVKCIALLVCSVLLAACSSEMPSAPGGPVDAKLVLAPGQTVSVDTAGIQIHFQGVTGDSRCPGDATCIQGGDAIVKIDVASSRDGTALLELHTGSLQPGRYGDLTIALEALSPYPFSSRPPILPNDYRATLRITR